MGFGVPLTKWLRGPLRSRAERLFESTALEALGIDSQYARQSWRQFVAGGSEQSHQIWNLFAIGAWAERWQPQPASAALAAR